MDGFIAQQHGVKASSTLASATSLATGPSPSTSKMPSSNKRKRCNGKWRNAHFPTPPSALPWSLPGHKIWPLGTLLHEWGIEATKEGDPKTFRVQLLKRTFVAMEPGVTIPEVQQGGENATMTGPCTTESLRETIHKRATKSNVLLEKSSRASAASEALASPCFRTLHRRVGTSVMVHLLSSCSVFFPPSPESRWLIQISGPPLGAKLSKATSSPSSRRGGASEPSYHQFSDLLRRGALGARQEARSNKQERKLDCEPHSAGKKRKRKRPPKWARRKQGKADDHGEAVGKRDHAASAPNTNLNRKTGQRKAKKKKRKNNAVLPWPGHFNRSRKPSFWDIAEQRGGTKRAARCVLASFILRRPGAKLGRLPKQLKPLLLLLQSALSRGKNAPMRTLLERCCHPKRDAGPMRSRNRQRKRRRGLEGQSITQEDDGTTRCERGTANMVRFYTPWNQVASFLFQTLKRVLPGELIGGKAGKRHWRKVAGKLCHLRVGEHIPLSQLMHGFPMKSFAWLLGGGPYGVGGGQSKFEKIAWRARNLTEWVARGVLLPLIHRCFVVTSSQQDRRRPFYFKRRVWQAIEAAGMSELSRSLYQPLSRSSAEQILRQNGSLSRLRLMPRSGGLRPIACMSDERRIAPPATDMYPPSCSVNASLHFALRVLQLEASKLSGATVLHYNTVLERLLKFKARIQGNGAQIFVCAADVNGAFDTLNQNRAWNVVNELLAEPDYFLWRCWFGRGVQGQQPFEEQRLAAASSSRMLAEELERGPRPPHGVLTRLYRHDSAPRERILSQVSDHIFKSVFRIHGRYWKQRSGVPQGSALSVLLCCLTYAHMEENFMQEHLYDGHGCLLRWIDDYLYLSTRREKVESFLTRLNRGFSAYGCFITPSKTVVNFDTSQGDEKGLVLCADGSKFIPWCGLLLDTTTLEVRADYTRYSGVHLRDTMRCFRRMRYVERLKAFVRPKCHPIFFHPLLNGSFTALLNFYQMFLVAAAKLHCHARACRQKLPGEKLILAILEAARYARSLVASRAKSVGAGGKRHMRLTRQACSYLALRAFWEVLHRKQARHDEAARALEGLLRSSAPLRKQSFRLHRVVDPVHSQFLDCMIF